MLFEIDQWQVHIDIEAETQHEWPHLQSFERRYLMQRREEITFGKPSFLRRADRIENLLNPIETLSQQQRKQQAKPEIVNGGRKL